MGTRVIIMFAVDTYNPFSCTTSVLTWLYVVNSQHVCVHAVLYYVDPHISSPYMLQSLINLIPQLAVTTSNMACSYVNYVVLYRLLYWTISKKAVVS